jgi:hypothetical protein
VIVDVEDTPDRVTKEVVILLPLGLFFGALFVLLGDGHEGLRDAMFGMNSDIDQLIIGPREPLEVRGLGLRSLADDEDDRKLRLFKRTGNEKCMACGR